MKALFISTLNAHTYSNLKEWLNEVTILNATLLQILTCLREHFQPAVNKIVLYNTFIHRLQGEEESAAAYLRALKDLIASLSLGHPATVSALLLYQFANGIRSPEIQTRLIANPTFTLQQALDLATTMETSRTSVLALRNGNGANENSVDATSVHRLRNFQRPHRGSSDPGKRPAPSTAKFQPRHKIKILCFRCGSKEHKANRCTHPPSALKCSSCSKVGHVEKVCGIRRSSPKQRHSKLYYVHAEEEDSTDSCLSSDSSAAPSVTEERKKAEKHLHQPPDLTLDWDFSELGLHNIDCALPQVPPEHRVKPFLKVLKVCRRPVVFEVDTGAGRTIITEAVFRRDFSTFHLHPSSLALVPWGGKETMHPVGEFLISVDWKGTTLELPLLVLPGKGPNLLGRDWLIKFLGEEFFTHNFDICSTSLHHLNDDLETKANLIMSKLPENVIKANDLPKLEHLVAKFPAVSGVGTGRYKGTPVHIEPIPGAVPKFQRARPVPFALSGKYEEAIQRRVDSGSWIPVEQSEWASATVSVAKRSGDLRICADYKATVNPAIREDVFAPPTHDEVFPSFGNARFFGEIDLEEAYTQLPVDLSTSHLLTVITVLGLFRPDTLQYGIKVAPAIFQRIVISLFTGIKGVIAYQDNIYISGTTVQEYLHRLFLVLLILSRAGFKVNPTKCNWGSGQINVLGFRVDCLGIHPTGEKVRAILSAPEPQSKQQLQSFLGLISFYSRFIPSKATILEPLHRLLDKTAQWIWTQSCKKAFDWVKAIFTKKQVLIHYSLKKPLIISCDASEYGVGAVIAHTESAGHLKEERPIAFASRTLSKAERNYAQLDKEALAIIFALKKFYRYVFGRSFVIYTDHKPLIGILDEGKSLPQHLSPRMLRWCLFLRTFQCRVVYKPGSQIGHADFLSRHPDQDQDQDQESLFPEPQGILLLSESCSVVCHTEVASATAQDPDLSQVLRFTIQGWPELVPASLRSFSTKRNELPVLKGCLLRRDRVIIPTNLRQRILQLLHSSHYGIAITKATARSLVWWPGLEKNIEDFIRNCEPCQLTAKKPADVPVSWPQPSGPWHRVHMDIAGPFMSHYSWCCIKPLCTPSLTFSFEVKASLLS